MKRIFLAGVPFATAILLAFKLFLNPLPIGSSLPSPDKKMKDVSGKAISFKDQFGKNGLLVMFSCNTCPVVHQYQSRTREVCHNALEKQIGVILLNSNEASRGYGDSFDDMKEYAKQQTYQWPYVLDQEADMANAFGASRTPECFLFNGDKKLVYHGAIDDNESGPENVTRKHLVIAMAEMLAGKEVSVKTTRSVGCTIRRVN